jgi:hypothetical protein
VGRCDDPRSGQVEGHDEVSFGSLRLQGLATPHLLNLASGADQRLTVPLAPGSPGLQTLAWSPDSQWLFAVAAHGKLVAINADTGRIQGVGIPLPPISQIAIRSSPH